MKKFSLTFINTMIGIVLGLGFQWWVDLKEPWQYLAFFFAYLNIIDYWIDYVPTLKKFPPRNEVDLLADVGILFMMFLMIYSALLSIFYFLIVYAIYRFFDLIWMARIRYEYSLSSQDKIFFNTWSIFGSIEGLVALSLVFLTKQFDLTPIFVLIIFVAFRVIMRILASIKYKKIHFS